MCGFLVSNREIADFDYVTFFLSRRGPDHTSIYKRNGVTFVHFLLSITGRFARQPFMDDDIVCVFNGEIYNAADVASDGDCLIPFYRMHGVTFSRFLDGEYAIVLVDFRERRVLFYSDIFGSKPLYVASEGSDWGISSYHSPLARMGFSNISKVAAAGYDFSLQQFKSTFDDWTTAFERSVSKRLSNRGVFIGLSSGYDSGAIDCALRRLGATYRAFTIGPEECPGRESTRMPFERVDLSLVEPGTVYDLSKDLATHGLSQICRAANQQGLRVNLSGQGADEIFSGYNVGRKFSMVQQLSKDFYSGRQERYLSKEEHVAGAYGIETRYPYLDKDVVQEFLWLSPELKNERYKAPLHYYMTKNSYPFIPEKKLGFGRGLGVKENASTKARWQRAWRRVRKLW